MNLNKAPNLTSFSVFDSVPQLFLDSHATNTKAVNQTLRLYLLRHGETKWNREQRFQGHKNPVLNFAGKKQAEAVKKLLKPIAFNHAFTSSLLRAKQTATIILDGQAVTLELKDQLKEVSHGDWEGKLEAEVQQRYPRQHLLWQTDPTKAIKPNGETLEQVRERVIPCWENIINSCTATTPKTILVVAHKYINQIILCHVCGLNLERFWDFPQINCAINIIDYPQGYQSAAYLRVTNLDAQLLNPIAA